MDLEDLRLLVRESIEKKIFEEAEILRSAPKSFEDFHKIVVNFLLKRNASQDVILQVEVLSSDNIGKILQESWSEIRKELSYSKDKNEMNSIWRDISDHYTKAIEKKILKGCLDEYR